MKIKEIHIESEPKFKILYDLPKDTHTIICIGGRAGMKTYEVSKFLACSATLKKKRCVIIRDEKSLIKESILNEIWLRYDTANESGILDKYFIKNEHELKDRETGKTLIYTKGFRASDKQKKATLKGASDIDIAVIEEAEDIRDEERFNTFVDSLRKDGCIVIIMLNTPDIGHFILKQNFNLIPSDCDGYFKLEPKKLKGVVQIITSYLDNPYLPQNVIDKYNSYGDKESPNYNQHYYLTSIKGYSSSGRTGQVHKNFKPIKKADYMSLPFKEYYGQDFGNPSPAALVGVKFDGQKVYCRLINYKPMSTLEIGKLYCSLNFSPVDRIIADNADEKAISKLSNGFKRDELTIDDIQRYPRLMNGFFIVKCVKGRDSVRAGIDLMNNHQMFAVEEDAELWEEINNRVYDKDKNGQLTNEPEPGFDHAIDGIVYIINDQRGKKKLKISLA